MLELKELIEKYNVKSLEEEIKFEDIKERAHLKELILNFGISDLGYFTAWNGTGPGFVHVLNLQKLSSEFEIDLGKNCVKGNFQPFINHLKAKDFYKKDLYSHDKYFEILENQANSGCLPLYDPMLATSHENSLQYIIVQALLENPSSNSSNFPYNDPSHWMIY